MSSIIDESNGHLSHLNKLEFGLIRAFLLYGPLRSVSFHEAAEKRACVHYMLEAALFELWTNCEKCRFNNNQMATKRIAPRVGSLALISRSKIPSSDNWNCDVGKSLAHSKRSRESVFIPAIPFAFDIRN